MGFVTYGKIKGGYIFQFSCLKFSLYRNVLQGSCKNVCCFITFEFCSMYINGYKLIKLSLVKE